MPAADAFYSERYCAFIDILGFSGLISDLERERISVEEIRQVLSVVHAPPKTTRPQEADLRSQSISDAVALSATATAAGFDAICAAAEMLSLRLLRSGYFVRGAITKGRLYHDPGTIFGPALVEAYRLESQIAKFPRIIVPRAVARDGLVYAEQGTHWKQYFDGRFIQAEDGPFFIDILRDHTRHLQKVVNHTMADDGTLPLLRMMRTAIQKRFDEASDNPNHFEKVAWFVVYWNGKISLLGAEGLEPIITRPL